MSAHHHTSPEARAQARSYQELWNRVRSMVARRFDACGAVEFLSGVTNGDIHLFGGSMRRALVGSELTGDLDIMVPNGDSRATDALDDLKVPYTLNTQHLRRYRWNSLEIDLFQPRDFFSGFDRVDSAVRFFDLRINALSVHWRTGVISDPFHIVSSTPVVNPGINWGRWSQMPESHVVVLAIRLAKIMHETPRLMLSGSDVHRLRHDVVPVIQRCDWSDVHRRFPLGKTAFLQLFESTTLARVQSVDIRQMTVIHGVRGAHGR